MLSKFNKNVLIISIIIFILAILLYGILVYSSINKMSNYPPIINDCPDYWDVSITSTGKKYCQTYHNINIGNYPIPNDYNYDISYTPDLDISCNNYKWAKEKNITWDGITNNSSLAHLCII